MLEKREMVVIDVIVLLVVGVPCLIFGVVALKYIACLIIALMGVLAIIAILGIRPKKRVELKCEPEKDALHKV